MASQFLAEKRETSASIKKISDEVEALKKQLQTEQQKRQDLEELIKSQLADVLQRIEADYDTGKFLQKISDLQTQLDEEVSARAKLTLWIKENIGPNLEHIKDATARQIKEEISRHGHTSSKPRSSSSIDGNTVTSKKSSTAKPAPEASHPTPKPKPEESSHTTVKKSSETTSTSSGHTATITKTKSTRRRKKQTEEELQLRDDEDSPWDQSDDESDEQLSLDQFIPPARPRLLARIPRLVLIEEHCFGTKNIDEYEMPDNDASKKTSLNRANYFLNKNSQAKFQYRCLELYQKVQKFQTRGGTIVFAPLTEDELAKDDFKFSIKTHDRVYPVCPDGLHRSQVLYLVMKGIKRILGVKEGVYLPHGALHGFDPLVYDENPNSLKSQAEFVHFSTELDKNTKISQAFLAAFGQEKAARFGQKECGANELNLNEAAKKDLFRNQVETIKRTRVRMHEFFDIYFYQQSLESNAKRPSRSIYLTFGSAVPIVLDRLMEVNANAGQLSNVTVVALPYGTESFNSPTITPQTLAQLYRFYSTLFKPLTDK
jgi:hypothetical protein